jgi:hypothetical protein
MGGGLTLCNAGSVTFKPVAVKDKVLVIYSVVYLCQLLVIVTRIRYHCLFVSIRYYLSVIVRCLTFASFSFEFCFDCCLRRKRTILNLTLFRYFDPVKKITCVTAIHQYLLTTAYSTSSSSRVNKHHTADSHRLCLSIGSEGTYYHYRQAG